MSFDGSPTDPRVVALRQDQQRRQTRFFVTFALIEGGLLALVAVLVYGFEVVDEDLGLGILIGIALVGGVILAAGLVTMMRRYQERLRDLGASPGSAGNTYDR